MAVIVISGIPGSGKTTLARQLSPALGAILISKDVIKEALLDALGTGDLAWTQQLSRAAHLVMYRIAADQPLDLVMEAHFYRGTAEPDLERLGHELVQVWSQCPIAVAHDRYRTRIDDPTRHPGHLPEHQNDEATRHWRESEPAPLDLDAPLIVVDTTTDVDIGRLAAQIREALNR